MLDHFKLLAVWGRVCVIRNGKRSISKLAIINRQGVDARGNLIMLTIFMWTLVAVAALAWAYHWLTDDGDRIDDDSEEHVE